MSNGTPRRAIPQLRLSGASEVVPANAPAAGQVASGFRSAGTSANARMNNMLGKFASEQLAEAVVVQQEGDMLDGQMAYQQGRAIEDLEMDGNKWALEGYRVMEAQTLSAAMLASQKTLITQQKHEDSPDAFRAQYVSMLEQQVEGLDERTAGMVRKTMTEQMVPLVAQHTQQHMQWKEGKAYQALVGSIATLSQDATGSEALLQNMSGAPGTASNGLSEARRQSAVVEGIITSLDAGNARALSIASSAGVIAGLPEADKARIRKANKAFNARKVRELSVAQTAELRELKTRIASGDLTGEAAADALHNLYAKFDIEATPEMLSAAYSAGADAQDLVLDGIGYEAEVAAATGDVDTLYKLVLPALIKQESNGDPDAVSSKGAEGLMQVMGPTQADPGFGIRPSDGSKADTVRVGEEYLKVMLGGSSANSILKWEAGDLEAALIAYNAGPGNANIFIESGRDYASLPKRSETEPYVKNIKKFMGLNLSAAEKKQQSAQRAKAAITRHSKIAEEANKAAEISAFEAYTVGNAQLQAELSRTGDRQAYIEGERALRRSTRVEVTKSMIGNATKVVQDDIKAAGDALSAEQKEIFEINAANVLENAELALSAEGLSVEGIQQIGEQTADALAKLRADAGLSLADTNASAAAKSLNSAMRKSFEDSMDQARDDGLIQHAQANGAISTLSPALREKFWQGERAKLIEAVQEYTASNPEITAPEQAELHRSLKLQSYAQSGAVDPVERERLSSTLTGTLLNSKGEARKDSIEAIGDYAYLKDQNPRAAERMMSEAARARAEKILNMVGGDVNQIAEGIFALENETAKSADVQIGATDMAIEVEDAVADLVETNTTDMVDWIFGSGSWSNYFSTSEPALEAYQEYAESGQLKRVITAEAEKIAARNKGLDGKTAVRMARDNVSRRTAHIGNVVITKMDGPDFATQIFGDRANDMHEPGIENEVITAWLANKAKTDPAFAAASGLSLAEVSKEIVNRVSGGTFFEDESGPSELRSVMNTGVRNFEAFVLNDQMFVRFILGGGTRSEPVAVDLKAAGDLYMEKHKQSLVNQ